MRVTMRMPSKKYNLVTNDDLDTRVPLHPEEAFTHGIKFNAKYIGTLDVPRPTSRIEIVAAMRRIRYEFKAKGIKKRKISLEVSVEGVKISLRKKKKHRLLDDNQLILLNHPIYRIFYVSHDSQDLKIFSYIARDASSNVFRCHVFKANKKNHSAEVEPVLSTAVAADERPRKKLSFRDPEVVAPSAPSNPQLLRPHSFTGVVGLAGYSSHLGVSGLPPSHPGPTRGVTSSPGIPRRPVHSRLSSPSPSRSNNEEPHKHNLQKDSQPPTSERIRHHVSLKPSQNHADSVDDQRTLSIENLRLENQAMRVVRTVGEAFEVCHKMAIKEKSPSPEPHTDDIISREGSDDSSDKPKKDGLDSESGQEDLMTLTSDTFNEEAPISPTRSSKLESTSTPPVGSNSNIFKKAGTPLSVHHELHLMREQLEQQQQQTHAAVAQVHLLRDQLTAETAARLEAQARTHHLLVHNKELLEHIQQLVLQVRDLEMKTPGTGVPSNIQMPPTFKSDLSPASLEAREWIPWQWQTQQIPCPTASSGILQEVSPMASPSLATRTFRFPTTLYSPHSLTPHSYLISPFPIDPYHESSTALQLQKSQLYKIWPEEASCSTASLSSCEGDAKKEASGQPQESVSHCLPRVPEDSSLLSHVGVPTGGRLGVPSLQSPFNGPITRVASERYSREDTLAQLQRMSWTRHTTK